ncbi:MAG: pyridoxal phosphate-dependent aminotransferase [Bacillota bacterium]
MIYNKIIDSLELSAIRKLNRLANKETINLGIGRPFCQTPEVIKKAGINAIENNKTYYTSNLGIKELRKKISDRYQLGNYKNSLVTLGAAEAIYLAIKTLTNYNDEVLIPNPGYLAYEPICNMVGLNAKSYYLNDKHKINFNKLEQLITSKTKMIIINHPGNPTGVSFSKKELKKLINICIKNDIYLISDESYIGINFSNNKLFSVADLSLDNNIIAISSLSKEYSMTGWRLGWIYTTNANINQLVKPHLFINSCATTISQYAGLKALESNPREVVKKLEINKNIMASYLEQINNIKYIESSSGLYYFIDISYYGNDKKLAKQILEDINVLTIYGSAFGENGKGYLRLSFGPKPNQIKKGMKKLSNYFNNLERI